MMKKFLYEGKVECLGSAIEGNCAGTQEYSSSQVLAGPPTRTALGPDALGDMDAPSNSGKGDSPMVPLCATPDVLILDLTVASLAHDLAQARRVQYERNW